MIITCFQVKKHIILLIIFLLFIFSNNKPYVAYFFAVFISAVSLLYLSVNKKIGFSELASLSILLGWLIMSLISTALSKDPVVGFKQLINVTLINVSSLVLISYVYRHGFLWECLLRVMTIFCFVLIIYLVMFLLDFKEYKDNNFSAIYNNRNVLAVACVFFLTILVWLKVENICEISKFNFNFVFFVLFVSIILTGSIKGLFGLTLILGVFFFKRISLRKTVRLLLIIMVLSSICIGSGIADKALSRLNAYMSTFTGGSEIGVTISAQERVWLFHKAFEVFSDNVFNGVGINNSQYYLISPFRNSNGVGGFEDGGTYSHINYIEILLNGGVFAFVAYYFPIFIILMCSIFAVCKDVNNAELFKLVFYIFALKIFFDFFMVSYDTFIVAFFQILATYLFFRSVPRFK